MKRIAILAVAIFAMCLLASESQAQSFYRGGGFGPYPGFNRGGISIGIGTGGFYNPGFGGYRGGLYNAYRPVYGGFGPRYYPSPIYRGSSFNRGYYGRGYCR